MTNDKPLKVRGVSLVFNLDMAREPFFEER